MAANGAYRFGNGITAMSERGWSPPGSLPEDYWRSRPFYTEPESHIAKRRWREADE